MMTRELDHTDTNSTKTRDMKFEFLMRRKNDEEILHPKSLENIVNLTTERMKSIQIVSR